MDALFIFSNTDYKQNRSFFVINKLLAKNFLVWFGLEWYDQFYAVATSGMLQL